MGNDYTEKREERLTLSVLMAVYRKDKSDYLDRALKSVWDEQTLRPEKIILIEDGPLDESLQTVISRWKIKIGNVLCLCLNKEHQGLTKCLNIGLRQVHTTLVARMDSDDISLPFRFEQQVRYLRQHPEIDILGGAIKEFNNECKCLNIRQYPLTHEKAVRYLLRASPLSHPAVMMRMRIFHQGLSYDERFNTSQDIALWFEAVSRGFRLSNLNEVVLSYRRENTFYERRSKAKARNECLIYLKGIYRLKGPFSFAYIYPLVRYCFRLFPLPIIKVIYNSRFRDFILNNHLLKSRNYERTTPRLPTGIWTKR